MSPTQLCRAATLLFCLPLSTAIAQEAGNTIDEGNVVEERVTYDHGVVRVCGEGAGLSPCLDANGQTYAEQVMGPDINHESEEELAAGAARIRAQSPKELEATISQMEKGYNPDVRATEGLPD